MDTMGGFMPGDREAPSARREFIGRLGVIAVAASAPKLATARRDSESAVGSPWDMSWVDRVMLAKYRVVFDANNIADGFALNLAADFLDTCHEVYGTRDDEARAVIVMRQLGTQMAFNDDLWDRYAIGEERKINDPSTHKPARRNPFWRAAPGTSGMMAESTVEALVARGAIVLVCNRAAMNIASSMAERTKRDVEEVRKDVRAGLVPGALLMPNGIFALIRAQNAGCAFMRGA